MRVYKLQRRFRNGEVTESDVVYSAAAARDLWRTWKENRDNDPFDDFDENASEEGEAQILSCLAHFDKDKLRAKRRWWRIEVCNVVLNAAVSVGSLGYAAFYIPNDKPYDKKQEALVYRSKWKLCYDAFCFRGRRPNPWEGPYPPRPNTPPPCGGTAVQPSPPPPKRCECCCHRD